MPNKAWRKLYRLAQEKGYKLEIPTYIERLTFRNDIRSMGRDPRENPYRVVYIVGHKKESYNQIFEVEREKRMRELYDLANSSLDESLKGTYVYIQYEPCTSKMKALAKKWDKIPIGGWGIIEDNEGDKYIICFVNKVEDR